MLRISGHAPGSQTGQPAWDVIWSSPDSHTTRTVNLAPDGHPVTGYLVTIWPRRTVSIVISYGSRTWSRTVYPFGSATPASGPAPRHETPAQGAARLRAEVASGQLTLVGPARVDGQRAIELRQGTAATGLLRMWVSPDTYLPIRTVSTPPGVPASSPQAIRDDYTWLPNTAASRRQLTRSAAIPAGFRQVSASWLAEGRYTRCLPSSLLRRSFVAPASLVGKTASRPSASWPAPPAARSLAGSAGGPLAGRLRRR